MTGPIDFADITVGMQVTATTSWVTTGASSATSATVVSVEQNVLTLSNGDVIVAPEFADAGTTVGFNLDEDAPTPPPPAPTLGTIYTDEMGAAWQATGATDTLVMLCIDGTTLDWPGFLDEHPDPVLMQDTPVVPLPAPVSPYPQTIAPADARLGMDIRVTVTYAEGGSKVVRGVCVFTYGDGDPTNAYPDFIELSLATGDVFAYNPVPDGQTLTVEQMQDWTVAADAWGFTNMLEPPIGAIVRSRSGVAWQRITDAAADDPNPYVTPGAGRWFPVTQSFAAVAITATALQESQLVTLTTPISWFWLWGNAAPFVVQEEA